MGGVSCFKSKIVKNRTTEPQMYLIQAIPDHTYFIWQLYVQMDNFREFGIEHQAIILVGTDGEPSEALKTFKAYTAATVICYPDTRAARNYPSSIRPHLLSKYFREHNHTAPFLYHDQDIIFLEKPNLDRLAEGNTCYTAAAAKGYIEIKNYLSKFKKYLIPCMCEILEVDEDLVHANDEFAGGAQYILKGMTAEFWEKCENDCEALYRMLTDFSTQGLRRYNPNVNLDDMGVQAWTADMWVLLWNLWRIGYKVEHAAEIDFAWPTDTWDNAKPIMHNAGIACDNETDGKGNFRFFNKARYAVRQPFSDRFDFVSPKYIQHRYVNYIHKLGSLQAQIS